MAVKVGHASISENGTIRGTAGEQNGKEVFTRTWYRHSKGWVTLRCKVPEMREHIARAMEKACANPNIGYDQIENQTLWNDVKKYGYDPSKTTKAVETDCARLIRVCVQYACEQVGNGKTIPDFYTATLANVLVKTGLFEKLTSSKYTTKDEYLIRGDVQVTQVKGHCWVVLENGSKVEPATPVKKIYSLGERVLRNGVVGTDVKTMQTYLIQLGYDCGRWGADGDFGDSTEIALKQFQKDHSLVVDGEYGKKSHAAMEKALDDGDKIVDNPRYVKIIGGNCYVRTSPNTSGKIIGVAHAGTALEYQKQTSENGWHLVSFNNKHGWVSGKYSEIVR